MAQNLKQLQAQQKKAGVTPSAAPLNARAAQANAKVQNQQRSQKLYEKQAPQVTQARNDLGKTQKSIANIEANFVNGEFQGTADELAQLETLYRQKDLLEGRVQSFARLQKDAMDPAVGDAKKLLAERDMVYAEQAKRNGVVDQSALRRLVASGKTPEQARKILDAQRGRVSETATNTGISPGAKYNPQIYSRQEQQENPGAPVPSALPPSPSTMGGETAPPVQGTGENAGSGSSYTESSYGDPAALMQDQVDAGAADSERLLDSAKDFAQGIFDSEKAQADTYNEFYQDEQERADAEAKSRLERETRDNELARKKADSEFQRAIRDQEIQNEQDREDWLVSSGISGAWKSSRHSADVIRALKQGENILADLKTDSAFSGEFFANKLSDIETTYHETRAQNAAAYKMASLQLLDGVRKAGNELISTVFSSASDAIKEKNKLRETMITEIGNLAEKRAENEQELNKFLITESRLLRAEGRTALSGAIDDAFRHVQLYGDSNPDGFAVLQQRIIDLGGTPFPAGTTLEQISKMKTDISSQVINTPHINNGVDYSPIGRSVTNRQPGGDRMAEVRKDLSGYLERKDWDGFTQAATAYGFESIPDAQKIFTQAQIGINLGRDADAGLATLKGDSNLLISYGNKTISQLLLSSGDLDWVKAFGRVANSQATFRNSIAGVAVTKNEEKFMANSIVSPGDTVQRALVKINNLNDFFRTKADVAQTMALGLGGDVVVKNGRIVRVSGKPAVPAGVPTKDDYDRRRQNMNTSHQGPPMSSVNYSESPDWTSWSKQYGVMTQDFNDPAGYIKGRQTHGGYDLAGKKGQAIQPLAGGKVVTIGRDAGNGNGWGNHVILEDVEGNFHLYAHLDSIPDWVTTAKNTGGSIGQRDILGYMGNTGYTKGATGIHLHYEIKSPNGTLIDPAQYYNRSTIASK